MLMGALIVLLQKQKCHFHPIDFLLAFLSAKELENHDFFTK